MKYLFAFLILLSSAFALYVPSSETSYSILGNTFFVQSDSADQKPNYECYGFTPTSSWGWASDNGALTCRVPPVGGCGVSGTGGVSYTMRGSYDGGGSASWTSTATIQMPSSGNHTMTFTAPLGTLSGTLAGAALGATGTITDYNSTHLFINSTGSVYVLKGSNQTLSMSETGITTNACVPESLGYLNISAYNMTNPVKFTPYIYTVSWSGGSSTTEQGLYNANSIYFGGYNNKTAISDALVGSSLYKDTSTSIHATLYYSDRLLTPMITYVPGQYAIASFYNSSNLVSYLPNNTVTYVLDQSTLQWYLVPAFSVTSYADTLSLGTILYTPALSTTNSGIVLPLALQCTRSANNLTIASQFQNSGTHLVTYGNSTNSSVYSVIGTTFAYSVDLATSPNVNYTFNGVTYCSNANANTTLLGLNVVQFPNYFKPIGYIFFIGALGISAVVPFALIFPVMMNDAFSFMSAIHMAIIICVVGVISAFVNHRGELSMKSLGVYLMFTMALLMYFFGEGNLTGVVNPATGTAYFASLQTAFTNFADIIYGNSNANSIGLFAVPAVAVNLLIQLAIFFVTLPITFTAMMMTMIQMVSPPLYTAIKMTFIDTALAVGATAFMLLKLYEVISNRFRGV